MPKILIVDDVPEMRGLIRDYLEVNNDDCKVTEAEDGQAALEMLPELHPDLILLDVTMPRMDGFELLERLQQDSNFAAIPVIMLTAVSEPVNIVKALELGALDHVSKPFNDAELLARVKLQLALKLAQDENKRQRKEIQERYDRRSEEIEKARMIQTGLFPTDEQLTWLKNLGLLVFVFTRPASELNGDGVRFQRSGKDAFTFSIFDCKEHGMGAAMMTMAVAASINDFEDPVAGEVLSNANKSLRNLTGVQEPVVAVSISYSPGKGFSFARAGFPCPLLYRKSENSLEKIKEGDFPLGAVDDWKYRTIPLKLELGDKFIVSSDGIFEERDKDGEAYGLSDDNNDPWHDSLAKHMALPVEECGRNLIQDWEDFRHGKQSDDATLFIIEKI